MKTCFTVTIVTVGLNGLILHIGAEAASLCAGSWRISLILYQMKHKSVVKD